MSTIIRPELSEKNPYYINKHRYYGLKHFCLQYPEWKKAMLDLYGYSHSSIVSSKGFVGSMSSVEKTIEQKLYLESLVRLVEDSCYDASEEFYLYLLKAVTEGYSYTYLKTVLSIPCCKETYYDIYRKFFWILSMVRKKYSWFYEIKIKEDCHGQDSLDRRRSVPFKEEIQWKKEAQKKV